MSVKKKPSSKKVLILGEPGAGKTSLIKSLCGRLYDFNERASRSAYETDFDVDSNSVFMDFSGQTIYTNENLNIINNANPEIVIFVVDPRKDNIMSQLDKWSNYLSTSSNQTIDRLLVVNKVDVVSGTNLNDFEIKGKYQIKKVFKTSIKDGIGIEELRNQLRVSLKTPVEELDGILKTVSIVVRQMVEKLCKLIAINPNALNSIEWRDLERVMAETLEELGFSIELTPSAKDGGKDIVARCTVNSKEYKFYVEIKHWREGGKPGEKQITQFVELNAFDKTDGGVFISSSGYTNSIYNRIAELTKQKIRLGDKNKIVSLCQYYQLSKDGLWEYDSPLPELLFENTLEKI